MTQLGRLRRLLCQIRGGTSALFSALNALPWDEDEGADSSDSDDDLMAARDSRGPGGGKLSRPKGKRLSALPSTTTHLTVSATRMQSSLNTIRPMSTQKEDDLVQVPPADQVKPPHTSHGLSFPFRANTIARRARTPGQKELSYQFAGMTTSEVREAERQSAEQGYFDNEESSSRRSSGETDEDDDGVPVNSPARHLMEHRISKEENMAGEEEAKEMNRVGHSPMTNSSGLAPPIPAADQRPSDDNAPAALREGSSEEEIIEDQMMVNPSEKKRLRREQLAERLQEVFGLEEREDVLDEMRCWLLRSVSKSPPSLDCV